MPSVAVPNPVPPPLAITEAEAVTFLRTVARMHGGFAVRLYRGGFKSPPERSRVVVGYCVMEATGLLRWNDLPAWVYDRATGLLRWCPPNALRGSGAPFVSWRSIDDPAEP